MTTQVDFLLFDSAGTLVSRGDCPLADLAFIAPADMHAAREPLGPVPEHGWAFAAGLVVAALPPPAAPIELRRDDRWEAAKLYREAQMAAGSATPLGRVDTDAKSQLKISGAVQMAMIAMGAGQPFSIDWTMSDNSVVAHDAAAMIALGVAVGQHVAACQLAGTAIRDAIAASDDPETIDITAGYPA